MGPIGAFYGGALPGNRPKSAKVALFLPFSPFSRGCQEHLGNPENGGKRPFSFRYPRISLNPHLFNPHLRHPKFGFSQEEGTKTFRTRFGSFFFLFLRVFQTLFRIEFSKFSAAKQRGRERQGPPKIIQKFRLRKCPISSADFPISPMERAEHHFGPFGRRIWGNIRRPLLLPAPLF